MVRCTATTLALRSSDEEQARRHRKLVPRSLTSPGGRTAPGGKRSTVARSYRRAAPSATSHEPPPLVLDDRRVREGGAGDSRAHARDVDEGNAVHSAVTSIGRFAGHICSTRSVSGITHYGGHIRKRRGDGPDRGRPSGPRFRQHGRGT